VEVWEQEKQMMACPWCGEEKSCKNGRDRRGEQV
jgi:hypothetical protein